MVTGITAHEAVRRFTGATMADVERRDSHLLFFTRQLLWSNSLNGLVGRLLGGLSILALTRHVLDFGLSATAAAVFTYYDRLLHVALGWADPYVEAWIAGISSLIDIHIVFNSYWHHVFVVLQLLFARDAGVAFAGGRRAVGFVRLAVGVLLATGAAILAALSFPGTPPLASNLAFASLPILGIFAYDFAMYCHAATFQIDYLNQTDGTPDRTRTDFFQAAMKRAALRLGLVLAVSYAVFAVPPIRHASAPAGGLAAIALGTVANASYWLGRGAAYAKAHRSAYRTWSTAFTDSEAGRFGLAITGVLVWALIFSTLNTGMQQIGL